MVLTFHINKLNSPMIGGLKDIRPSESTLLDDTHEKLKMGSSYGSFSYRFPMRV